jgi:hypothetical protein
VTPAPAPGRRGCHEGRRGPPAIYPPDMMKAGRDAEPYSERAGQGDRFAQWWLPRRDGGRDAHPIRDGLPGGKEATRWPEGFRRGPHHRTSERRPADASGDTTLTVAPAPTAGHHPIAWFQLAGAFALAALWHSTCCRPSSARGRWSRLWSVYVSSLKVPPKMSEFPNVGGHWLLGPGRSASECDPGSSAAEARSRGRSPTIGWASPARTSSTNACR